MVGTPLHNHYILCEGCFRVIESYSCGCEDDWIKKTDERLCDSCLARTEKERDDLAYADRCEEGNPGHGTAEAATRTGHTS